MYSNSYLLYDMMVRTECFVKDNKQHMALYVLIFHAPVRGQSFGFVPQFKELFSVSSNDLDYSEKTHLCTWSTCKLHTEGPQLSFELKALFL